MMSLFSSSTSSVSTPLRRPLRYGVCLVGIIVLLGGVPQAAATPPPDQDAERESADSTMVASSSVSGDEPRIEIFTWGNLAALLLLGGGGAFALYLRQGGGETAANAPFRPLGQLALGQSQQLRLVACGEEVLLLGVTDDEVALLKTYPLEAFEHLESPEETGSTLPTPAGPSSGVSDAVPHGFADVLKRVAQRDSFS